MSCQLDRAISVMDNKHKYVADLKHPHPLYPIIPLPPTDLELPTLYTPSPFYHPQTWNCPPSAPHHPFITYRLGTAHPLHPITLLPPTDLKLPTLCTPVSLPPHCPFTTLSQHSCQVLVLTLWSLQVNCCWRPRSRVKRSPPHLVLTCRSPATWNSPGCHPVERHFIRRSTLLAC